MKKKERILALEAYAKRVRKLLDEQAIKAQEINRRLTTLATAVEDLMITADKTAPRFFPPANLDEMRRAFRSWLPPAEAGERR